MAAPNKPWGYYQEEITRILGTKEWTIKNHKGNVCDMSLLAPNLVGGDDPFNYNFYISTKRKSMWHSGYDDTTIAQWNFHLMPSQCGMLISHASLIYNDKNKG